MELYEPGTANIWTDLHIREQMLLAHLYSATDAASRNPATSRATVDWILHDRNKPGILIDFGCGPGLYAEIFARRGWNVLGIDINVFSLEYARKVASEKNLDIQYLEGSYLEPFSEAVFDLGVCIYCDFGALQVSQQKQFLNNANKLIVPGGRFVFDVFGPGLSKTKEEGKAWTRESAGGFWSKRPCYVLSEVEHFETEGVWGQKYIVIPDGEEPKTYVLWDHYFTEEKVSKLLGEFGFEVEEFKSSLVNKNEFTSEDVLFIKARKT